MGFSERFPRWVTAIIGVGQLLLTAAIVGLEIGSAYIDLGHGTIWVGIWAGLVFIITFLMMLFISKSLPISSPSFHCIEFSFQLAAAVVVAVQDMSSS
jgi:hypothetical protein